MLLFVNMDTFGKALPLQGSGMLYRPITEQCMQYNIIDLILLLVKVVFIVASQLSVNKQCQK